MIELYLILTFATNTPKIEVFNTEQQACQVFNEYRNQGGSVPHIYKESGRKDGPVLSEGDCKPIQQFVK